MQRFYLSYFLLASLVLIFAGCTDNRKIMLFLGDSMIPEEGVSTEYTLPSLLEHQLDSFEVVDWGSNDWTTHTFLEQWDEIKKDYPSHAEFIFIQLGINDLLKYGQNDLTISNCIYDMERIAIKLRTRYPQAKIVLMSNLKVELANMSKEKRESGYESSTNDFLSRIAAGYAIVAADNGYMFIDLHRLVPGARTVDGKHLDKSGQSIVANIITRFLRALADAEAAN